MLLEFFPFVILDNAMAFVNTYFFSNFLRFYTSLLIIDRYSNKHCLLSLSSLCLDLHGHII